MSRRSYTTLTIQVRLRIPPGSNAKEVLEYVRGALQLHKKSRVETGTEDTPRYKHDHPLASLDTDSMIVKLEKKETVYL